MKSTTSDNSTDQLRLIRDFLLLLPPQKVFRLLGISNRRLWERLRQEKPGLPVYKTMEPSLERGEFKTMTKGVEAKLLRNLPAREQSMRLLQELADHGLAIPAATSWCALFEEDLFHSEIAANYWCTSIREIAFLRGPNFSSLPLAKDRALAYETSGLPAKLGCPAARALLAENIPLWDEACDLSDTPELKHAMACDALATLVRLAAWIMADWQAHNWHLTEQDGIENTALCVSFIPRYSSETASWSDPARLAIDRLAEIAGWKRKQLAVTFLGKLWGGSENAESKTRLLRDWLNHRGGRPSYEMLYDLVKTCRLEQARLKGHEIGNWDLDYWFHACIFRVGESLSILIQEFIDSGISPELIDSATSVYEPEYRMARAMLGRPFTD